MAAITMPPLPVPHDQFIEYVAAHPSTPIPELLQPFHQYENELRKVFAQQPEHAAAKQSSVIPVFAGHEQDVKIRARNLDLESDKLKETYIMPLKSAERKPNGALAIANSLQDFKTNFNLFTESSLADLNWDNVVVAGSAVVTSLLSVPSEHAHSKRSLRRYYHEIIAPASDVDLFLYDLTEEQAVEKIKEIERNVRDALLVETTTIRTKNTITIASQYPVRHVQIVLRIYKSITEILTGFDVDCSCGAYDGKQVWASPRALAAYMTQTNTLDLTRRSPSYENRLSKYRHRGFEVRFPELDRIRIDPTIYERSFKGVEGLARLLILEKLPKSSEREAYIDQRRVERGRPAADRSRMKQHLARGNIKSKWEDEVAEWVDADEVSSYHTFTVPYGPKFHARKIDRLLYAKDLLLNAEWNKTKGREVNLHRHPAFFGSVDDVITDCCGHCPSPTTVEEEEVAEKESKIYVSGAVQFMKDNCGRQAIGSFNPLSPEQYTDMAYVGNTQLLCQAIIDQDIHYVEQWLGQEGNNPSTRDHTGRCPLHLAVSSSTLEIVQSLIDHGARLVARLVDGKTALHLACLRGDPRLVEALLKKSEANEEDEANKTEAKRKLRPAAKATEVSEDTSMSSAPDTTFEIIDKDDAKIDVDAMTDGSVVHVKAPEANTEDALAEQDEESPDVYDVNVLTWDTPTSPLHLAILSGNASVVKCLVQDFGANILLPVILPPRYAGGPPEGTLLTLTLATRLPVEEAKEMTRLLLELGASCAQADVKQKTALESCIENKPDLLETYLDSDPTGANRALKHVSVQGPTYSLQVSGPLLTAISNRDEESAIRLLRAGARPDVPFESYLKGVEKTSNRSNFEDNVDQPVISAVQNEMPLLAATLIEQYGVDSNTMTKEGWRGVHSSFGHRQSGETLLNLVKEKVKQLREWKSETPKNDPPHPLKDGEFYLGGYQEGTYQHWSATKQLERAKSHYESDWKSHVDKAQRLTHNEQGLDEKNAAIYDKLDQFRKLEALLHAKSAKTFKELYPDVEERDDRGHDYRYRGYHPAPRDPFEVTFDFSLAVPNEETRARYIRLFESTWSGDVKVIKELTLLPWTNAKGEKCPPLQIAVHDRLESSPLSMAVLGGKLELASMTMEIAAAQYTPPEAPKPRQYHIDNDSVSDEDDKDDGQDADDVLIASEAIDDQMTVEDIGTVSLSAKSDVKPKTMLNWPKRLVETALKRNDMHLLSFILDLAEKYADKTDVEDEPGYDRLISSWTQYNRGEITLPYALRYGQPHLLAELIKRTAIGVSVDKLALDNGANDATEKPKYYQGLTVHGKKRKDWADAGRNSTGKDETGPEIPPLLMAARYGKLEHLEWFLSDAPLRCYKHFAQTHQDDKRIQNLSQLPGGFEGLVKKFLGTRSNLALHCCLTKPRTEDSLDMLKYLIEAMPDALEAKSAGGLTPLLLAFRTHDLEAVRVLLDAGADQTVRDKEGMNLLHHVLALTTVGIVDIDHIRKLIDTIDTRLLPYMYTQRCSASPGSLTPLAFLISLHYQSNEIRVDMARLILEYSHGAELEMLNGEGHTALHVIVRTDPGQICHHHFKLAEVILEHRPDLVTWENATGKSPLEMIEDNILARRCSSSPDDGTPSNRRRRRYFCSNRNESITDTQPRSFLKPEIDAEKALEALDENLDGHAEVSARQRSERLRGVLLKRKAGLDMEGSGKRRLVTLNEASEVARRLAAVQRKRVEKEEAKEDEDGGDDHDKDEVEGWLSSAQRWGQ